MTDRAPLGQRLALLGRRAARSRARRLARALVPRPARDALRTAKRRAMVAAYRGRAVECPCCGGRWRRFRPAWNRPGAICPGCDAQERHRGLWLYLRERPALLLREGTSLLHLAPEPVLAARLRERTDLRYLSADLSDPQADERFDLAAIPHPEDSFDAILCSHVLEHVEDDAAALRELNRVLRPGGTALLMVPMDEHRARTHEDPTITSPEDREREFRQDDHVRLYGRDFPDRVAAAGFEVEEERWLRDLDPETRRRHGLGAGNLIFIARKTPTPTGEFSPVPGERPTARARKG